MSDQLKLIQHLLRNPVRHALGFETWLADASQTALGIDRQSAEQLAARRKQRLWTEFSKFDQELSKRGCIRIFEIVDERSKIFCTPPLSDSNHTSAKRFAHEERHRVVTWIDGLGDRKFEFLGAAVTWFLGAPKSEVTSGGNDAGVDFYALMPSWGATGIFHSPQKYLKVVGQSKYYSTPVGTDVAKLLVKTVEDVRSYTVEMAQRLPVWFREHRGPVVGMIVAPFGFQSGAVTRAHNSGVLLADAIDVAEAIIASQGYRRRRAVGMTPQEILEVGVAAVGWRGP